MGEHHGNNDAVLVSPAFNPLAAGDEGDVRPSSEQVSAIVSILSNAGICCCFVQEFALVYYGTRRVPSDRILCIPDEHHKHVVEIFTSQNDILELCDPLPLTKPDSLNHKYLRFRTHGRIAFWLILPASYCHIICEPDNIEWSQNGLPYPTFPVYVQSLLDTKNGVDLEDLIDGMDLLEELRGGQSLNLEGYTDTKGLEGIIDALQKDGRDEMSIWLDPDPVPRRQIWQEVVRNKQMRMGWKYPPEIHATRFRRHGSKDPRIRHIPEL